MTDDVILDVADLTVAFATPDGPVHAVNGVDLQLHAGEALAVLGESGCGKSVTMQAIMGLVRSPPGRVCAQRLRFRDIDLQTAPDAVLRTIRGPRIGMVFQDPFMSLDPTRTVGEQIGEMFRVHRHASRASARRQSLDLMERARIPSARRRIDDYPHQFSGGMSQRVMIACAIALSPDILIADEPTTALDVTVQAQIMDLLADMFKATPRAFRALRRHVQIVFQDPFASLNPRMRVGDIVGEPLEIFPDLVEPARRAARVRELLTWVGLERAAGSRYPHEFSGGQRQRIGIARALALEPSLIVCDEPVSALDVSVQAQVVNLLEDIQQQTGVSYLFIAHDLSVVRHVAHRVLVMYLGRVVEEGTAEEVYRQPTHPYTLALLSAAPSPGGSARRILLDGEIPDPANPPTGCRFRTRCWRVTERCANEEPVLQARGTATHRSACHHPLPDGMAMLGPLSASRSAGPIPPA